MSIFDRVSNNISVGMKKEKRTKIPAANIIMIRKIYLSLKKTWVIAFGASAIVCVFYWQYLFTGNKLINGDFDYYAQLYEAFRISVLRYHQFPLWNPWMSGGVPLFANPQFGLISIQSLLALCFGAVYGLKLAYVLYAIAGYWGMYVLLTRSVGASRLRSLLVSFIWLFSGFFAGHSISHFTFALFFLLPWLIYFIDTRHSKRHSWLWFACIEALIILSSIHYALLMTGLAVGVYLMHTLVRHKSLHDLKYWKEELEFVTKSAGLIIILSGYRFVITYLYVARNPKIPALLIDHPNSPKLLLEALFLPIGTLLPIPTGLQWGWWEYSMYIGLGATLVLLAILVWFCVRLIKRRSVGAFSNPTFVIGILVIGALAFTFAIGDKAPWAPYHLLRLLPGFSDTRVAARWLFFTMFSVMIIIASWKKFSTAVNILLLASAIELFLSFGPPNFTGKNQIVLPGTHFNAAFSEYDNSHHHLDAPTNLMHSYFYSTSMNVGQIYSDESSVDTLDNVIGTSRCGFNVSRSCMFVLSDNAVVVSWSPNEIIIRRLASGPVELNMNVDAGWMVNSAYPFANVHQLDPTRRFVLSDNSPTYHLVYAPRFSLPWVLWHVDKL